MSLRQSLARLNLPLARFRNSVNPGARVLMYHRVNEPGHYDQLTVTPATFDEQMQWLSINRNVQSTSATFNSIKIGEKRNNMVAITFDDGYLDNLEIALPILEKYELPATIYITTDFADQKTSHPRYARADKRLHLHWEEIEFLSNHPLITIGSHTVTHPMLSELSNKKALKEIKHSKETIETKLNHSIDEFCYPSGNHTWRECQMVEQVGYNFAVTVKPGVNRRGRDPFAFRRTEVNDKDQSDAFTMKMDGAFDVFHRLLDFKREVIFYRKRRNSKNNK